MPADDFYEEMAQGEPYTIVELPPWLIGLLDQRMALVKDKLIGNHLRELQAQKTVIVMALTDPSPLVSYEVWNQSCDRCGRHVPNQLHDGLVAYEWEGIAFHVNYGLCPPCHKEVTRDGEHHPG